MKWSVILILFSIHSFAEAQLMDTCNKAFKKYFQPNSNQAEEMHKAIILGDNLQLQRHIDEKRVWLNGRYKGKTLILQATYSENIPAIAMLLEAGASPNKGGRNGESPLQKAVNLQNVDIVQKLLEGNANPNMYNKNEMTPFNLALLNPEIVKNKPQIIYLLIEAGAWVYDPFKVDLGRSKDGAAIIVYRTPFKVATDLGAVHIQRALVEAGFPVSKKVLSRLNMDE